MEGWVSWHRQTEGGAVESEQRVVLGAPVVEFSAAGAKRLGPRVLVRGRARDVRLVRPRMRNGSLELRLFLVGPALLRFGLPTVVASDERAVALRLTVDCSRDVRLE
jgi:hypothetical protein